MTWQAITSEKDIDAIDALSNTQSVVIFKHSTRCSISVMALNRIDSAEPKESTSFFLLDLLSHRSVSNYIAEKYKVHHESPQVLIIKNGECIYDESHNGITMQDILEQL